MQISLNRVRERRNDGTIVTRLQLPAPTKEQLRFEHSLGARYHGYQGPILDRPPHARIVQPSRRSQETMMS